MSENQATIHPEQTSTDELKFVVSFPQFTPAMLFRYWIEPELLVKWWPPRAQIDPRLDGLYEMIWPAMNWRLHGRFSAFEPGKHLAFTWNWDHEPEMPMRDVDVRFEPTAESGTLLTLTHGTYTASNSDQTDRQSHVEGWSHFLSQLLSQTPDAQTIF